MAKSLVYFAFFLSFCEIRTKPALSLNSRLDAVIARVHRMPNPANAVISYVVSIITYVILSKCHNQFLFVWISGF